MPTNPYLAGLELAKEHSGTSGQMAMVKLILSLYSSRNAFAMSDILASLDSRYSAAALAMVAEYAKHGETEALRDAGRWCVANFPGLIELATAMAEARDQVHHRWEREREDAIRREEEAERKRVAEREAQALQLECAFCKATTKHYPEGGMFMCIECGEVRDE